MNCGQLTAAVIKQSCFLRLLSSEVRFLAQSDDTLFSKNTLNLAREKERRNDLINNSASNFIYSLVVHRSNCVVSTFPRRLGLRIIVARQTRRRWRCSLVPGGRTVASNPSEFINSLALCRVFSPSPRGNASLRDSARREKLSIISRLILADDA